MFLHYDVFLRISCLLLLGQTASTQWYSFFKNKIIIVLTCKFMAYIFLMFFCLILIVHQTKVCQYIQMDRITIGRTRQNMEQDVPLSLAIRHTSNYTTLQTRMYRESTRDQYPADYKLLYPGKSGLSSLQQSPQQP